MEKENPAVTEFSDSIQRLLELTLDLRLNHCYPKGNKGVRELNRDARVALVQFDRTIQQGITSGVMRPVHGLGNTVMLFLNDAAMLMKTLYAMRNRGSISRRTWRRARRLHRAMWWAVGDPPHTRF